ncbi:MAG: ABC transporter substrate-binding protein [Victivallales bacterium]|nr:ABC transporter substrate-binding protein [Victivallales bacterium]
MKINLRQRVLFRWMVWTIMSVFLCLDAESREPPLRPVRLLFNHDDRILSLGYRVAQDKGFFRDAGLEVELVVNIDEERIYDEVAAGKAQFGVADSRLIYERARGRALVALAAFQQHSAREFLTLKSSGLSAPAMFRGKRLILRPLPSDPEMWALLLYYGIKPDAVTLVGGGGVSSLYEGFADVFTSCSRSDGMLLDRAHLNYYHFSPNREKLFFYRGILFTSDALMRKEPEMVRNFIRAAMKGWYFAFAHPEETVALIREKHARIPVEQLRAQLTVERQLAGPLSQLGRITTVGCNRIADFYVRVGLLPKNYNLAGFVMPQPEYRQADYLCYGWNATALTPAERQWLERKPSISVIAPEQPPFSTWHHHDPGGILNEYLLAVSYKYNLPLTFRREGDIVPEKADILLVAGSGPDWRRHFTVSAISLKIAAAVYGRPGAISRAEWNHGNIGTIGVIDSPSLLEMLRLRFNNGHFVTYADPAAAVAAWRQGRLRAIVAVTYPMDNYLHVVGGGDGPEKLFPAEGIYGRAMVVVNKSQPYLLSIIDTAVASMPVKMHGAIYSNWLQRSEPFYRNEAAPGGWRDWWLAGIIGAVMAVMICLVQRSFRWRTVVSAQEKHGKQMRILLGTMDAAVFLSDLDHNRIVECNPAAVQLYGYRREELLQRNLADLGFDFDAEQELSVGLSRVRLCSRGGRRFVANCRHSRVFFEGCNYLVTVVRDVSAIVAAEIAARKQEENFRAILNSIGDAVVTVDAAGKIVIMNPVAEEMIGTTLRDCHGRRWQEVIELLDAGNREPVVSPLKEVLDSGRAVAPGDKLVLVSAGKREYRVIISAAPIFDDRHTCRGVVLVLRDITVACRCDEEIKLWADRLNTAADAAEFGIWECMVTDGEIRKVVVNEMWRKLYEMPSTVTDVLSFWQKGLDDDDWHSVLEALQAALHDNSGLFIREVRFRLPGDRMKWLYTVNKLIRIPDRDGVWRLIGIHQDVTERKNSEEQLIRARQSAETANLAKSQFIAAMSHEIRTPMNGIIGFVELLKESSLDDEQRHCCETALKACYTLLGLLNDVLDFARIDTGHLSLRPDLFSLEQLLNELETMVRALLLHKPVQFRMTVPENLPIVVNGDQLRIRQILTNLLTNAIKFTERGLVELLVAIEKEAEHRARFCFTVKDNGIGINEQDQKAIFDRFRQIDGSLVRKYGGVGLGLAICNELATLMGGRISVHSIPGEGSEFTFEVSLSLPAAPITGPEITLPADNRCPVLIVEDSRVNQMVISRQLQHHGFGAEVAENGRIAIEMASRRHYALILMDCLMPEMDGFETAAWLRNHDNPNRKTPIVALTADAVGSSPQKCLAAGMNDCLVKPVRIEALLHILNRFIREETAGAAVSAAGDVDGETPAPMTEPGTK